MQTYIIKRVLLMIPTFFSISLIIFLILNLAPGKPGGELLSAEGESGDGGGAKRQAYLIFKQQFNLDKPIILNTRFSLGKEEIEKYLKQILNEDKKTPSKYIIKAQDTVEDYGQYAVPHLIKIIEETQNPKLRYIAVMYLSQNARRRIINPYATDIDEKTKILNREIDSENLYLSTLTFTPDAGEEEQKKIVNKWKEWYGKNKNRYEYSFGKKLNIFFLDTRFARYWWNLIHLDFGVSHVDKQPVIKTILSKLKYSLSLSVSAVFIAYIISIPLGIFAAVKQNTVYDRTISVVLFLLYSLPSFFVATMLLTYFSQGGGYIQLFPTGGFISREASQMTTLEQIKDVIWHLILPIVCMTYASFASLSRYARAGLLEVIRSDYIRTARAKGLSEFVVIGKHAVRNGMIPIVTLLGTLLPVVISGSVIIEYIFGIPGMGTLTINAIFNRDYNTIMGVQLISATLLLVGLLISDITYSLVDPRISFK